VSNVVPGCPTRRARRDRDARIPAEEAQRERQLHSRLVLAEREHQLVAGGEERVVIAEPVVAHARIGLPAVLHERERHRREGVLRLA
jgi:hypothetical protein